MAVKGYDKVKKQYFYRLLGGGIEFGETAEEALRHEFLEELGVDMQKNIIYPQIKFSEK